jgi:Uncharacterised nucleotidyltransferase
MTTWRPARSRLAARALLAECMLGVAGERPRLPRLAAAPLDWDHFVALASEHAVTETAYRALAAHGVSAPADGPAAGVLREAYEAATARNLLLLAEAARVQAALQAGSVPSALLKGAALVAAHHDVPGARHVADVDLLVRQEHVAAAIAAVRALGARPFASTTAEEHADPVMDHAKHAPALVLPSGIVIEVHRRYGRRAETGEATRHILERAREVEWLGRTVWVASPSDLLGVACHHVLDGHRADRRFRPRHLADCALLLRAGARGVAAASLPDAARPVRESLRLLEAAEAGDLDAARRMLSTAASRAGARLVALDKLRRGALDGPGLKLLFFPARSYLAWRYGVPRSSPLLPLLYLWRPIRGCWRLVTGH